mmetsp:Transcript_141490/g.452315  ORF Transcript_141490/g.452315 Transcript_141490/m.452315 type:complete len:460 (+) Transcript_141490:98-1477(+)
MSGDGPESVGVAHINEHGKVEFGGCLLCSWSEAKGRILRATRTWKEGEEILVEHPLHIVVEDEKCAAFKLLKKLCKEHDEHFDYEPLWYWCAIQSLTAEQLKGAKGCSGAFPEVQRNLLLLHHEEVDEPSRAANMIVKEIAPNADPITVERLIQIWVLNCFEYSDKPQGYSTYFFSSFMSHSCCPNAVWHYTGTDHVLRCRRDISVGDEVCISYLPENGLLQSAPNRRMELHETKRFWCDCERCLPDHDDFSRGLVCPKPKCKKGVVFAKTPAAGPAKDNTLLPVHLIGSTCSECGEAMTRPEATKLAALEKKLQELVDEYTESDKDPPQRKLELDEAFVDEHFRQHVLADLFFEQLCTAYGSKKKYGEQRRLLERRCAFHKAAYPGLSGAHAWACEALGDCHRALSAQNANGKKASFADAQRCYHEALEVLRLMFGPDHEYVTDVESKEALLEIEAIR